MKEISLPTRFHMIVGNLLNGEAQKAKPSTRPRPVKEASKGRQARAERKDFVYYQKLVDQDTQEFIGHLSDISSSGFKLDTEKPLPVNKDFRFRMNLTSEVADKPFMVFVARSKWCKVDPIDPYVYNIGYQLIHISPGDLEIFNRMMEKYGREPSGKINLRRSNKW